MVGIVGFGSYVPSYRLPREVIAREWGTVAGPGEKAVANHDEDSLTLAVNAAVDAVADPTNLDAVFFASTTPPYREKQSATTVATVLEAPASARTADFADSLRAATGAMLAGLDAVRAGSRQALICAGDCRLGEPDSMSEPSYGDAGAAIVVGGDELLAEVVATYSLSDEFHSTWRTDEQAFLHHFPGAFDTKYGYARVMTTLITEVLSRAGISAAALSKAVLSGPNPRVLAGVGKAVGIDVKQQLHDTLWTQLGDTGAAQPLLLLAAALERSKPNDTILLAAYGDGGDAFVLRVTERIDDFRPARSVYTQIERKRTLSSYGKYARFRKLFKRDPGTPDVSTPVALFRDRQIILPLHGSRCTQCGTVQFPRPRTCIECGHAELSDVKLARCGRLFTFTNDYIFDSADTPVPHAVVDLDGGGRIYLQMTDCDAQQIEIDMPVELTFRRYHEGFGIQNYFWKARPAA
ncbi:MAG TPA: OB-fold domain-containing protein [Candidatus Acidoferrales bacterium]|nr:OB-fold domain-containing protein [Candidatus Acidoferrales bacterium]